MQTHCFQTPIGGDGWPVAADKVFIVQRRGGDVMISLYAGEDRPDEATPEVAKQVSPLRTGCMQWNVLSLEHCMSPRMS